MRISVRRGCPSFAASLLCLGLCSAGCDEAPVQRHDDAAAPHDGSPPLVDGHTPVNDSTTPPADPQFCAPRSPCWEAPLPQGNTLNGIWGSASDHIVAVGGGSTRLYFDGKDWTFKPAPVSVAAGKLPPGDVKSESPSFIGVWGEGKNSLYLLANGPALFHLKGTTWSSFDLAKPPGKDFLPLAIWGLDPGHIYIVGNRETILHFDGTKVSQMKVQPDPQGGTSSVRFMHIWGTAPNNLWATSYQWVWHFEGVEWKRVTLPKDWKSGFDGIWGSGASDIFANGHEMVHFNGSTWSKTTLQDGYGGEIWGQGPTEVYAMRSEQGSPSQNFWRYDGKAWSKLPPSPLGKKRATALWGGKTDTLYATAEGGLLVRHTKGQGWTTVLPTLPGGSTMALWGTDKDNVWAGREDGALLRRDASGWAKASFPGTGDVQALWGIGTKAIFASVGGAMWSYSGSSWTKLNAPAGTTFGDAIWGTAANNVYATTKLPQNASGLKPVVMRYDGKVWSPEKLLDNGDYHGIWGSSPKDIYAVGGCGKIMHYDGSVWAKSHSVGCGTGPRGVWGTGSDSVFVVGWTVGPGKSSWTSSDERGWIAHFDGKTWTEKTVLIASRFNGVWGRGPNEVYAVGFHYPGNASIQRYDGKLWSPLRIDLSGPLHTIWGDSKALAPEVKTHVFVGGSGGAILHRGLPK